MNVMLEPLRIKQLSRMLSISLVGLWVATASAADPRIVNGIEAQANEFPWQVALISDQTNVFDSQFCGGTLVHEKWVVTAAHCAPVPIETTYIVAGITNLADTVSGKVSEVTWFVHPEYDEDSIDNDIALLRLETPIDLNTCATCEAISLVTSENEATAMPEGTVSKVSGWGNIIGGENINGDAAYLEELQWTNLNITNCTNSPSLYLESDITQNMFCAGVVDFDSDACQGDSGGPLVVNGSDGVSTLLAGVVSWGDGCAVQGYPGVYTRVANYEDWIIQTTNGECCSDKEEVTEVKSSSGSGGISILIIFLSLLLGFRERLTNSSTSRASSK